MICLAQKGWHFPRRSRWFFHCSMPPLVFQACCLRLRKVGLRLSSFALKGFYFPFKDGGWQVLVWDLERLRLDGPSPQFSGILFPQRDSMLSQLPWCAHLGFPIQRTKGGEGQEARNWGQDTL